MVKFVSKILQPEVSSLFEILSEIRAHRIAKLVLIVTCTCFTNCKLLIYTNINFYLKVRFRVVPGEEAGIFFPVNLHSSVWINKHVLI